MNTPTTFDALHLRNASLGKKKHFLAPPGLPVSAGALPKGPQLASECWGPRAPRLPRDAFIGGANIDHAVFLCMLS